MLRFSKDWFHMTSTKLYGKCGNHGGIQATAIFAACQIINKKYATLIFFFKQDYNTAGNIKMLLLQVSKDYFIGTLPWGNTGCLTIKLLNYGTLKF